MPIIPEFLYTIRHQNDAPRNTSTSLVTPLATPPTSTSFANVEISAEGSLTGYDLMDDEDDDDLEDLDEDEYPESTTAKISPEEKMKHDELVKENVEVGVMFASKAFVQLIANPFVGPLTNKYVVIFSFLTSNTM